MARLLICLLILFHFQESTAFSFSRKRPYAKETFKRELQKQLFDEPNHMPDSSETFVRKKTNRDVKNIQELNERLHRLQTTLANIQEDNWSANNDSKALEEQVEFLWEALTQKDVDIHNLKVRAEAAAESLNQLKPQLQVMEEIISEQWIQIQQHEQALQKSSLTTFKTDQQIRIKCPVFEFIKYFLKELHKMVKLGLDFLVSNGWPTLKLWISEASDYLRRAHITGKYYYHQYMKDLLQELHKMAKFALDFLVSYGGHALKFCISEGSVYLNLTYTAAKYYYHQLQDYIMQQTVMGHYLRSISADEVVVFPMVFSLLVISVSCIIMLLCWT